MSSDFPSTWVRSGIRRKSTAVIILENEHTIVLEGDQVPTSANDPIFSMDTKLTAYFNYNAGLTESRRILYRDIPKHCTWKSIVKEVGHSYSTAIKCPKHRNRVKRVAEWRTRERRHALTMGRLYTVSPSQSDLYHLRILLAYVKATGWEDLYTYEGTRYRSYAEVSDKQFAIDFIRGI